MTEEAVILWGLERSRAATLVAENHYLHSVPMGKSHYMRFCDALVIWSIPSNNNIGKFLLGYPGIVWELSRLWAPDGHEHNLLTQAISAATKQLVKIEKPDVVVSYADPHVGHNGGVYRAASWIYSGLSEEVRCYSGDAGIRARRSFHSGRISLTKSDIERLGFVEIKTTGKHRFVRPLSIGAKRSLAGRGAPKKLTSTPAQLSFLQEIAG